MAGVKRLLVHLKTSTMLYFSVTFVKKQKHFRSIIHYDYYFY